MFGMLRRMVLTATSPRCRVYGPGTAAPTPPAPPTPTPTPTQLTGTPSANTTASYNNNGETYANVFDGNTSTFFDSPSADGNYVQLDLGSAQTITQIAYAPRTGFESRMTGGIIEVSNAPTFASGVATLYTVSAPPADGLTTQTVNPGGTYRYVRYVAPSGSYGNIAELQVFGPATTPVTPPPASQLTGTASANTTASYDGKTSDNFTAAFDGSTSTFFDAPTANGNYVQLDLGSAKTITSIAYAPRVGFEGRMVGGIFEASNDSTFATGVTVLDTITSTPADGLNTQAINVTGTFEFVRYIAPTARTATSPRCSFSACD